MLWAPVLFLCPFTFPQALARGAPGRAVPTGKGAPKSTGSGPPCFQSHVRLSSKGMSGEDDTQPRGPPAGPPLVPTCGGAEGKRMLGPEVLTTISQPGKVGGDRGWEKTISGPTDLRQRDLPRRHRLSPCQASSQGGAGVSNSTFSRLRAWGGASSPPAEGPFPVAQRPARQLHPCPTHSALCRTPCPTPTRRCCGHSIHQPRGCRGHRTSRPASVAVTGRCQALGDAEGTARTAQGRRVGRAWGLRPGACGRPALEVQRMKDGIPPLALSRGPQGPMNYFSQENTIDSVLQPPSRPSPSL